MGATSMVPADRPTFTVVSTKGISYDANNLVCAWDWAAQGYLVHFVCSGGVTVLKASEVERIEYTPAGGMLCGFCDRPLTDNPRAAPALPGTPAAEMEPDAG